MRCPLALGRVGMKRSRRGALKPEACTGGAPVQAVFYGPG